MLRVGTLLAARWSSWCGPFTASLVSLSVFLSFSRSVETLLLQLSSQGLWVLELNSSQVNSTQLSLCHFHSHSRAFVFVGKCSWAVEKLKLFAVRSHCAAPRWPDFGFCQAKRVKSIAAVAAGPWRDDAATLSRRASYVRLSWEKKRGKLQSNVRRSAQYLLFPIHSPSSSSVSSSHKKEQQQMHTFSLFHFCLFFISL